LAEALDANRLAQHGTDLAKERQRLFVARPRHRMFGARQRDVA